MRTHIDWLTFTMTPRYEAGYPEGATQADMYAQAIEGAFRATFGDSLVADAFGGEWEKNARSRAPYTDAWKSKDGGITLFASETLSHCCIEISGQGCETLISKGLLGKVLHCVQSRVTRIDIACDIETDCRPQEFVGVTTHERMRASGYQTSETGETCYVGSQKSDRYARVYRYNDPHPRSHLLRIEHVFRREYAKVVAEKCAENNIDAIAVASGRAFGWAHAEWQPEKMDDASIQISHDRREQGNTVFWLVNSVAPAFKRLCANGSIRDPEEFLRDYFLSPTKDA